MLPRLLLALCCFTVGVFIAWTPLHVLVSLAIPWALFGIAIIEGWVVLRVSKAEPKRNGRRLPEKHFVILELGDPNAENEWTKD